MKKILFSLLILAALKSNAQVDSSKAFVVVAVQYRDLWLMQGMGILSPLNPILKTAYDSVQAKTVRINPADSTTTMNIVTQARGIIMMSNALRDRRLMPLQLSYARINNAFRVNSVGATGKPWMIARLDELDEVDRLLEKAMQARGKEQNTSVDN